MKWFFQGGGRSICVVRCAVLFVYTYGKLSLKTLKSVVSDYYSAEVLSEAKVQLASDIDKLSLTVQRPHAATP